MDQRVAVDRRHRLGGQAHRATLGAEGGIKVQAQVRAEVVDDALGAPRLARNARLRELGIESRVLADSTNVETAPEHTQAPSPSLRKRSRHHAVCGQKDEVRAVILSQWAMNIFNKRVPTEQPELHGHCPGRGKI